MANPDNIYLRRKTDQVCEIDKTEDRILELIEDTSDAKDKAFLLILLKLNNSLGDNTQVVHDVAQKLDTHMRVFEQHAQEEFAQFHKKDGAKKILTYFIGFLQTAAIGAVAYFQSELVTLHVEVNDLKTKAAVQEEVVKQHIVVTSPNK